MDSLMERIVHYTRLDPSGGIAKFFTVTVANLDSVVLLWLALAYIVLRFAEGYGLWLERHWGEWLAVLSAFVYVPAEIYELILHFSLRKVGVLVVNIVIIAFLGWVLWKTRNRRKALGAAS